ncbi:MAG: hypothetical protein WAV95_18440 [Azonexus sp.]
MNKALRILGKGLLLILAIPVVLYLMLLLSNLRDDPIDPELAKLIATAPPQIPATENGYFAWIGVPGPADQTPAAWGQRWFQEALAMDKTPSGIDSGTDLAINAEKREDGLRAKDIACDRIETCLENVSADPELARAVQEKGRITLARGDTALAFPAYQEAWRPDSTLVSHWPNHPHFWRQLSATRFALTVAEGHHDEALDRLGREMDFHIRQMQGAQTLIEYLLAAASLRTDTGLLNQYMVREPQAARQRAERIAPLLAPLPENATRLKAVLLTEARIQSRTLLFLMEHNKSSQSFSGNWFSDTLLGPLWLPQATANASYDKYRRIVAPDDLTGAAYRQALADISREADSEAQSTYVLRNPIGHILNNIAQPNYSSYFLRRDDLIAQRAMLAFQLALLRQGITDAEAIAQALPGAGLIHPYTGEKPVWDRASRTLSYATLPARNGSKTLDVRF